MQEEIERLRKEGSKQVEEEVNYVISQLQKEKMNITSEDNWDGSKYRIKIKWKAAKNDSDNGGYSQEMLQRFLSKYGDITALVMSSKKTGSALVEFKTRRGAVSVIILNLYI